MTDPTSGLDQYLAQLEAATAAAKAAADEVRAAVTAQAAVNDAQTARLTAQDAKITSLEAAVAKLSAPPVTPPSTPPTGLKATPTSTSVALSWTAPTVGTVTGYQVLRGGSVLASTTGTSFTDTAVSASTSYTYAVKALLADGSTSPVSDPVTVTTPAVVTPPPPPPPSGTGTLDRPFASTSRWNTPITTAPAANANLTAYWRAFPMNAWINCERYSIPVYVATTSDPVCTLNTKYEGVKSCRIPAAAVPAAGTDSNMCIMQSDGTVWDVWQATWVTPGKSLNVGRAEFTNFVTGDGFGPQAGIRASGASTRGGLITEFDIKSGKIEHALAIATPADMMLYTGGPWGYDAQGYATAKGYIAPATEQDASSAYGSYKGQLPMGARLFLPSSFDLAGLNPSERMIAEAMIKYGAYVLDTTGANGGVVFYAEPSINVNQKAWLTAAYGASWGAQGLNRIRQSLIVAA